MSSSRSGAQAVDRALELLHVIASEGGQGLPLSVIAGRARLDAGTARRLLLALMRSGFVAQDSATRQYHIGLDFFSIAAAAANRFDAGGRRRRILAEVSRQLGLHAAFLMREGDDMVCLDVVHGPGSAAGPEMGARRPIGAEAFGLAVLSALPVEEGESIVIRNVRRYSRTPEAAVRQVGDHLRAARAVGYAIVPEPFAAGWALAVAISNRDGRAEAALGIAADGPLPDDGAQHAQTVLAAAEALQSDLWRHPRGGAQPQRCDPDRLLFTS